MLEINKLRIFDVIESVNDKSATELLTSGKELQECFDYHVKGKISVKLHVNRSISLPPVSTILDSGM